MSRPRKAVPISIATEALAWRARIVCEVLEGQEGDNQTIGALTNLSRALADYEASRNSVGQANQGVLGL